MFPPDEKSFEVAKSIIDTFNLSVEQFTKIRDSLFDCMVRGLNLQTREKSSVKMYPSYVTKLPNGTESGKCLALDLGGTNYRCLLVSMQGNQPPKMDERTYSIPKDKMSGNGEQLFDYIAHTLGNFLEVHGLQKEQMNLGFTFSFPCNQYGLAEAKLVRWTKGFSAKGVEGKDVAKLLQEALDKLKLNVKCVAVVNDTVGTLASCALTDQHCKIGIIIGTGTNAAYVEDIANVQLMHQNKNSPTKGSVIINTEWGAFGDNGELDAFRNDYDRQLDKESLYPGKQIFEKMCSGMYLGELVRLICADLTRRALLFRGRMPERLQKKDTFHTKYITETERDPPHLFYSTHYMLTEDIGVGVVDQVDDCIVRYACEKVSMRAAYLIGAGIAAMLHRMQSEDVTIAIDGSLYKFHPKFRERMTDIIDKLKPKNARFHIKLSEDGSGKGAAAIAAAAMRKH